MSASMLNGAEDGPLLSKSEPEKRNAEKNVTRDKRRDIQGLRGIAIIYVLLFHLNPKLLPQGFLGVDIFFVISGFLITMILVRCKPLRLADIANFFSKRVRRIYPAYYVMIVSVLAFACYILIEEDYNILKTDAKWALSFASNIQKYVQNNDYFAEIGNFDFLLHAWSLAAEIQFYLVAPLLVGIAQFGKAGNIFVCIVIASSLVFNCSTSGPLHFSSLPSRMWQFGCGGAAYTLQTRSNGKVLIFLCCLLISPAFLFAPIPETPARIVVTAASSLIVALNDKYVNQYILGNSILYFIGEVSYSLYLAHWPIITFVKYVENVDFLGWKDAVIAAELSFAISVISYKTIEKYFIRKGILASAVTVGFLCLAACAMIFNGNDKLQTTKEITEIGVGEAIQNRSREKATRFETACYEFCQVPYLPANISEEIRAKAIFQNKKIMDYNKPPDLSMYDKYDLTDPMQPANVSRTVKFPPRYLKGNGTINAAVFGNSFSSRAFPAVVEAFDNRVKEIRLFEAAGCMSFEKTAAKAEANFRKRCDPFVEESMTTIAKIMPDVIFLINRPLWGILDKFENLESDQIYQSMQHTINRLSNVTKQIILQMPLPLIAKRSYTPLLIKALQRNSSLDNLYIPYNVFYAHHRYAFERLKNLRCPKCTWIYPHKIFCNATVCRAFDPDNLYSFFDHNEHYNPYAGKCLKRLYQDTIDELFSESYI